MGMLDAEIDANFFNLVHQLATDQRRKAPDRRGADRQRFVSTQRIALRRGAGIPDESEFFEVQCHDLTRQGFSFLLPRAPTFHFLVAAFGAPPEAIYVSARVARCQEVWVDRSGRVQGYLDDVSSGGDPPNSVQLMYLVGCSFLERFDRPAERESLATAGVS
jgi:hypothetical protein